jgi:hypothetical protein
MGTYTRQECRHCGAHTMRAYCGNCGGLDLRPVNELPRELKGPSPLRRLFAANGRSRLRGL